MGMRNVLKSKIMLVPIKEMTDVLSVKSREVDISRETWVRLKNGTYKGDLAKVYLVIPYLFCVFCVFLLFRSIYVRFSFL